ncbi:MAG: hypothetical protein ACM3XZ_05425 [Betaproteobacteria bacterium]
MVLGLDPLDVGLECLPPFLLPPVAAVLPPASGTVVVDGVDMAEMVLAMRSVGAALSVVR